MVDSFADQLRSELDAIQAQVDRLAARRRLIEELLSLESPGDHTAPQGAASAGRPARRRAAKAAPRRRPRGLVSGTVREFLEQRSEPAHATEILAHLQQHDAAPRSAKPMATLQSTLQRMKEQGEIENTGRNHWRLSAAPATKPDVVPPAAHVGTPVVTSTTTFGARPSATQ
ncbi:MAG: hypothetical protein F4Y35_09770 [Chloroflexi bacterium]|nr:hypothetical protein [Chloroflexota bacterium]